MMRPNFQEVISTAEPFPHARIPDILHVNDANRLLAWLRTRAPWKLRIESFYEQHECSLIPERLEPDVEGLLADGFVSELRHNLAELFRISGRLELVDVSAHRLTVGQTIRVHNDYIGSAETHRLLIQLNDGWTADHGGLLMLFTDNRPESVKNVIMPAHGSGFAFEISPKSFHAVSSIKDGERFTIVYTFRLGPGCGGPTDRFDH